MLFLPLLLISTLLFSGCSLFKSSHQQPPAFAALINDLKLYELDHPETLHAGNLYEHLLWTHYAATRLLEEPSAWTHGFTFTERDKQLLNLAAFLHDLGKAGRGTLFNGTHPSLMYKSVLNDSGKTIKIIYTHDNKDHIKVGFDYLAEVFLPIEKQQHYTLSCAVPMSIQPLMHQLGITLEEQKIIAILVGMHYDFGMIIGGKLTTADYLSNLRAYAQTVRHSPIDEKLLRLAVLIQIADVTGMTYVKPRPTWLFPDAPEAHEVRTINPSAYQRFGYHTDEPIIVFSSLLEEFKRQDKQVQ